FNLTSAVRPADLDAFVRLVSPELRRRGLLVDAEGGTFREAVLGKGPRLADDHRGAGDRVGAASVK
ncbi:MAG: 5,10-methylene tetrahydromethanopterin reductase, partial [Leifsonia sp.]|nr:5,10-methylene tetrahydromethanopterin reductase [Leifsonia sp.]